jgi:uncharacterized membrane protein
MDTTATSTTAAAARRRTSLTVTALIAVAFLVASIVFAANTTWYFVFKMIHVGAAVLWVGGGTFLIIAAVMAELADNEAHLLEVGRLADQIASKVFPIMSFVVLGFGIAMTMNGDIPYDQFWIIFGLIAWAASAATGIFFIAPQSKTLTRLMRERGAHDPAVQDRLRRILLVSRVDVALMFLIVFDMVVKPFS